MPKLKTNKTISKRIRVTKTGKLLKRHGGQDHFNTRNPGKITRKKRRDQEVAQVYSKTIRKAMPNS